MSQWLNDLGFQPSVLLAGFLGGIVKIATGGKTTIREAITSPICGAICAGYLSSPVLHYVDKIGILNPTPDNYASMIGAVGFLVGICAMRITSIVLAALPALPRMFKTKQSQEN